MPETKTTVTAAQLDARAQWLDALRSGDYRQATGALRIRDGYCCLGVAEDVRGATWTDVPADDGVRATHVGTHQLYDDEVDGAEGSALTSACARWLGLRSINPFVSVKVPLKSDDEDVEEFVVDRDAVNWDDPPEVWRNVTLAELNDEHKFTFREIARVVEDQPANWDGGDGSVEAETARRRASDSVSPC